MYTFNRLTKKNIYTYSLKYINDEITMPNGSLAIFIVIYFLNNDNFPHFSPNLEIDDEPNFYGLVTSLLEDMVEMGLYMERIADSYPPYNVKMLIWYMHLFKYNFKYQIIGRY